MHELTIYKFELSITFDILICISVSLTFLCLTDNLIICKATKRITILYSDNFQIIIVDILFYNDPCPQCRVYTRGNLDLLGFNQYLELERAKEEANRELAAASNGLGGNGQL